MTRFIVYILAISVATCFCANAEGEVSVGSRAPAFVLSTSTGTEFDSEKSLVGIPSVVVFWRLEQKYSTKALTDIQRLYIENKNSGLRVVGICAGTSNVEAVTAVAQKIGITFPLLLDPDRKAYAAFGVFVSPATYLLDAKGFVRYYRPSHNSDFFEHTSLDVELILGKISDEEHDTRLTAHTSTVTRASNASGAHYKLGLQFLRRGDRKAAKEQFELAWENEATSIDAGIELGFMLLDDRAAEEALTVFAKVVRLAPKRPLAQGGYAAALVRTGEIEKGTELLRRVLKEHSKEPFLYYELGRVREEEGAHEEALALFRRGLEVALKNR